MSALAPGRHNGRRRLRITLAVPLTLAGAAFAWHSASLQVAAAESPPRDADTARVALRGQPLDAAGLRVMALEQGQQGAQSDRLLKLSAAVTRRDRETQIYLLEARARAGDIAGTLAHYDALLSTTPELAGLLFGVLGQALSDRSVVAGLADYRGRQWLPGLVRHAAGAGGDPRGALALARAADLLAESRARDDLAPALISGLLEAGAGAEAAAVADRLGLSQWRGMGFNVQTLDPRLGGLGWKLESQGAASASTIGAGVLAVTAQPQRLGIVARRTTAWSPGRYRLAYKVEVPAIAAASVIWRLACVPGGAGLVNLVNGQIDAGGRHGVVVTVGADCPQQEWSLWAEGADSQVPSSALVSEVSVEAL